MKYSKKMFIKEGQALKLNDTQTVLEIGNETNKGSVEKDLKIDFESFKTLYKGKIDDKCMADYNTIDDKALWEDTAKEMFLKSVEYIPEDTTKAKENLDKTVESKECPNQKNIDKNSLTEKKENLSVNAENTEVLVSKNQYNYITMGLIIDNKNKQFQLVNGQTLPTGKYKTASKTAIRQKAEELELHGYTKINGTNSLNETFVDIKTENAKYSKRSLIKESISKDIPAIDNLNKSLVTKMLDTFNSNGKYAHRGNWSIANGGYDLYWEIYYDGLPVIRDINGNVSEELNGWENWAKFVADYYKETYSSELVESKEDKAQQKEECNNTKPLNEAIEVHQELNPKIWNTDNTINEEIAKKLKDIAEEFIKYVEIPLNIVDIEIVGSNASYNYNENSDLDLHIIVNSEVNYVEPTILRQLYNSKKNSFNDNYDLSVNGVPIELYIEDVKDGNATNGRYSLMKDEWVVFPEPITYEIPDISEQLAEYENKCNEALNSTDGNAILELVNDIYMMRKIGLAADGEASVGNLVFKELRNQDMLQKLKDRYYEIKSTELSE